MDSNPMNNTPLPTWVVDGSGNIAISSAGVALLDDEKARGENEPSVVPDDDESPIE
jgi:hypothetical protein